MSELMLRGILLCPFDDHGDIVLMQLRGACGQAVEEMDRLRADCECYEAMKDGVQQRIAELEAERDRLRAENAALTTICNSLSTENVRLLKAAEVVAACERWGLGASKCGDLWLPRFGDERAGEWLRSTDIDFLGYATFSDAVLASAKWLEEREAT